MKSLLTICTSFASRVDAILSSVWGWIMLLFSIVCNHFAGTGYAFVAVLLAVVLDTIVGTWAAVKRKKYATSEQFRDLFSKVFLYVGALVFIIICERLFHFDTHLTSDICAGLICVCELWSFAGNALIINPKLSFFKMLQPALVGEIVKKTGMTEEAVKSYLYNEDKKDVKPEMRHDKASWQ